MDNDEWVRLRAVAGELAVEEGEKEETAEKGPSVQALR